MSGPSTGSVGPGGEWPFDKPFDKLRTGWVASRLLKDGDARGKRKVGSYHEGKTISCILA